MNLRDKQREHSFILLTEREFAEFTAKRKLALPFRHREHFGRILRRSSTWPALIGNGLGQLIHATADRENLAAAGDEFAAQPLARRVIIVQAWVKQKALALILQKCSELGVAGIILTDSDLASPHSEKPERMRAIMENACMQSYNAHMPALTVIGNMAELPHAPESSFFGDLASPQKLGTAAQGRGETSYFFNGPEGGWSEREVELLRQRALGVLLSENVLRAETAAIIAAGFLTLL